MFNWIYFTLINIYTAKNSPENLKVNLMGNSLTTFP